MGSGDRIRQSVYIQTQPIPIENKALQLWLAEELLDVSEAEMLPLEQINRSPLLFPFHIDLTIPDLRTSPPPGSGPAGAGPDHGGTEIGYRQKNRRTAPIFVFYEVVNKDPPGYFTQYLIWRGIITR